MCVNAAAAYECQTSCRGDDDSHPCGPLDEQRQSATGILERKDSCCEQVNLDITCKKNCCGTDEPKSVSFMTLNDSYDARAHDQCETGMSSPSRSCPDKPDETRCDNSCCGPAKSSPMDVLSDRVLGLKDSCDSRLSVDKARDDHKEGLCCSFEVEESEKKSTSSKVPSPCHDECCAEDEMLNNDGGSESSHETKNKCSTSSTNFPTQACRSHLDAAFRKYSAFLEQGRCICRSVLGSAEICCSKNRRKTATGFSALSKPSVMRRRNHGHTEKLHKSKNEPKAPVTLPARETTAKHQQAQYMARSQDVEKAGSGEYIHVSLKISGMTCTSCSKKGMSVLEQMHYVKGASINFVAGTGDFELDCSVSPQMAITQLEHETGFKCSRVIKECQTVDIQMSKLEARQLDEQAISGIESVLQINKNTHSIIYNPTVIGARSVLQLVPSRKLAAPRNDALNDEQKRVRKMAWRIALAAAITIPVVVLAWAKTPLPYFKRSIISFVLATCAQAIAIPEFYYGAVKSLVFSKVVEMDMLVVISITAAYGYSVVAFSLTHRGYDLEEGEFFETSSLLITLVLLGRLVSAVARKQAFRMVSMKSLLAETALLIDESGQSTEIDSRLLEYDDLCIIAPYSRIITDGEIVRGTGDVDESMITGEAIPVPKKAGNVVIAGTTNGSSQITIRVTRLPGQNSITDIANLVESALASKPRSQDLADTVASWFIPVVVGISLIVFALWIAIAIRIRKRNAGGSIGLAITYGIAVLAVSCPCALGLAVPMVMIIAGGVAVKSGVIIKQGSATEDASRTTDVIFDKTGTLTMGLLTASDEVDPEHPHLETADIKPLVLGVLEHGGHPVSSAIAGKLQSQGTASLHVEQVQSIPGAGLTAIYNGKEVKAGNPYWLGISDYPSISQLINRGATVLCVTLDSQLIATYGLTSTLRPEAVAVVRNLHARKITCHIVSGDNATAVADVAQATGIDPQNTVSRQSPADKQAYVKALIDAGKTVLYCGDGTNDAVAVAQAHIGVQMGTTSDVTQAMADVVLMGGLDGIPALLDLSKQAFGRIVFNFVWAGVYNTFAILLAAGAFVKVRIPPAYAGLGEIVSVLPVILVALTLKEYKRKAL